MKTALKKLKKIYMNFYAKEKWLILFCILILVVLNFVRFSGVGEDSYFHTRIAENLFSNLKILVYDELSSGGREINEEIGFGLILGIFSFLNVGIVSKVLMIIFGVMSFILFYKIIEHKFNKKLRVLSCIFLLLSPCFLYLFSVNGNYSVAMFLSLIVFYFFNKRRIFSFISLALIPFFSVGFFICVLLFVLIYCFRVKDYLFLFFSIFLMFLVSFIYRPYEFIFSRVESIFFIFGNAFGLSLFVFILSLFGLFYLLRERKKKKIFYFYLEFVLFFFISYFFSYFLFYFNFLIVILGSYGFVRLIGRKWESVDVKKWTIFIVLCGLFFSCVSFFGWYIDAMPNEEVISGLLFLRDQEEGVVFSDFSRGIWINSISGKKNVVDKFTRDEKRIRDTKNFLYSMDSGEIDEFIKEYGVNYVFIDYDMKKKLWEKDEEGLLYVLKFSKRFKRIYNEKGVEVWKVKY
jgi:hypothetical protein